MYKCKKCGGTDFETWTARGALYGNCKNCDAPTLLESSQEYEQYIREQITPSKPTVECPYCQSTDTKKISGTTRFVSTGLFGLASSKVGKQWHCNKCKSDF